MEGGGAIEGRVDVRMRDGRLERRKEEKGRRERKIRDPN